MGRVVGMVMPQKGMLTKPSVQSRDVWTCVVGIFQTGMVLLEKELLLY